MSRTTYPNTRLQALFNPHCEHCNSKNHRSGNCWLITHQHYAGLVEGMIHADPDLEALYRREYMIIGPNPPKLQERLTPIREWAWAEAKRREANP